MSDTPPADVFARIATERHAQRATNLVSPEPVPVPNRSLPLDKQPGRSAFTPTRRMDTPAQLARELAGQRKRYARFLRDLSPELADGRIRKPIRSFEWREETAGDRRDLSAALHGGGSWKSVTIPHFGPPLGKAVTYYRTEVTFSKRLIDRGALFIHFDGVDYKCRVYFNGACLGEHEGFFAPFEFDCTSLARTGTNVLLVRVENDSPGMGHGGNSGTGDKIYAATGPGYDDPELGWHHCPPGMGIYQDVYVEARPRMFVSDVWVRTREVVSVAQGSTRDGQGGEGASASVEAWIEITNCELGERHITLDLSVFGQNFRKTVFRGRRMTPHTTQIRGHGDVDQFTTPRVEQLMGPGVNYLRIPIEIPCVRLWEMESPWLYQLQVRVLSENGQAADAVRQQFGVRTFTQDEGSIPKGKFHLNGREVRLRGANTMGHLQQCVMRGNLDQLRDDILLAKICNMNFLRLTQRPVQKKIYEICDRLGLMTQTDLPLFGVLRRNQMLEAVKQCREMERLIRPYASSVIVSYINEPYPNATGKPHRHLVREELDAFFDIASKVIRLENPDRVVKCCDGDYDPPAPFGMPDNHCYCGWYIGHAIDLGKLNRGYWLGVQPGWHYGCGEFGAEGLDPVATMLKHYPAEWLRLEGERSPAEASAKAGPRKPHEPEWTPAAIKAAQTWRFHFLWFPTQRTMADWVEASQDHQAWIARLMTEAFRRDARMNSFAIHLFIDAWPAGWMKTIMDVDRQPKKAYFAYRDALTPLMVSLRTDRSAFFAGETIELEPWICNDTPVAHARTVLRYQLERNGRVVASGMTRAEVSPCTSAYPGTIRFCAPVVATRTELTARLALLDNRGEILHDTQVDLEVFPARQAPAGTVRVVGDRKGPAAALARELGCRRRFSGSFSVIEPILIDSIERFNEQRAAIGRAVSGGATALFLELPPGTYRIASDSVVVAEGGMGKRHFASCDTNHPLVEGFRPHDIKFWYDESVGYPTPLLETVVRAEGWETVVNSGNGDWRSEWRPAPACIEKRDGNGVWRICQVKLHNRTRTNPSAAVLATRLMGP